MKHGLLQHSRKPKDTDPGIELYTGVVQCIVVFFQACTGNTVGNHTDKTELAAEKEMGGGVGGWDKRKRKTSLMFCGGGKGMEEQREGERDSSISVQGVSLLCHYL